MSLNVRHVGQIRLEKFDASYTTYRGTDFVRDIDTARARIRSYTLKGYKVWAFRVAAGDRLHRLSNTDLGLK